jgi:hypothetical protein
VWLFRKKSVPKTELGAFANFVSEVGLRHIEESSGKSPPPRRENIRYIVLQVRDDTPEDLQRHLEQALEIVVRQGGVVESIMSSIVSVIFKPTPDPQDRPVDALLGRLGSNVRAVYGRANVCVVFWASRLLSATVRSCRTSTGRLKSCSTWNSGHQQRFSILKARRAQ